MNDPVLKLVITSIINETPDTRSYWLEPTNGRPVSFVPGQFLTLLITYNGHEVRRSYSLSSLPAEGLRITIRRVPNGDISRYLLDTLRVGDILTSLAPAGRFTLPLRDDISPTEMSSLRASATVRDDISPTEMSSRQASPRDIVLFGAGSGITPLFALLRQALYEEPQSHVTLLYSNTRSTNVIFADELTRLHQEYRERFTLVHLISQPGEADGELGGTVRAGRLSNTLLETLLPTLLKHDPAAATFFICGPTDYMRAVQFTLIVLGFRAEQMRKENFVVEPISLAPAPAVAQDRTILLKFRERDIEIDVPAYVSILQAALDAGIHLPYSCRGGRCSTCAARCISGHVLMTINDVLTERDLAEGWVLTCTGYPETDGVVIDV